jgi:hypothetical protein
MMLRDVIEIVEGVELDAGAAEGPERIEVFHGKGDGLAGEQTPFKPVDLAVEVGLLRRPAQLFGFLRGALLEGFHAGQLGGVALLRLLQLRADLLRQCRGLVGGAFRVDARGLVACGLCAEEQAAHRCRHAPW